MLTNVVNGASEGLALQDAVAQALRSPAASAPPVEPAAPMAGPVAASSPYPQVVLKLHKIKKVYVQLE